MNVATRYPSGFGSISPLGNTRSQDLLINSFHTVPDTSKVSFVIVVGDYDRFHWIRSKKNKNHLGVACLGKSLLSLTLHCNECVSNADPLKGAYLYAVV